MIAGTLAEIRKQAQPTCGLEKALDFLAEIDPIDLSDGKVLIEGDRVFAIISHYTTQEYGEEVEVEGHRKYIDVQYIAAGSEAIGWMGAGKIKDALNYDANTDAWKCTVPVNHLTMLKLSGGDAAVLYPEDAHCPQLASGTPQPVVKVVVKVMI